MKLFFSQGELENNLVSDLLEENLKLQTEANEAKSETNAVRSENLKLQTAVNTSKSEINAIRSENLINWGQFIKISDSTDPRWKIEIVKTLGWYEKEPW